MYSEIEANKRKTIFLIAIFILLISSLAYFAGLYFNNFVITIGALIGSVGYAFFSYFGASKAALAFNNAAEIQKSDNPRLWRIVENLAITDGLPMPKVHIMNDEGLNAFATGRDPKHASVAVTTGLLNVMDDTELQGVMAHEMGHIKNYDIRVSLVVFGLVMVISVLTDILLRMSFFNDGDDDMPAPLLIIGLIAMVLAPVVAALVQAAISRNREFLADATGALTTRYPEGLASALEKIKVGGSTMKRQNTSTAHLFFANPLKGKSVVKLFSTHPPIDDRIVKLRTMGTKI